MFGGNKNELIIENVKLSVENESLKKQNEQLLKMVDRLQEALVAKEAPQAFASQVADRLNAQSYTAPDSKLTSQEKIALAYIQQMESGPAFGPEDMDGLLGNFATTLTDVSTHNNSES